MFKELNAKRTIKEGIDLNDLQFCKLSEMEGKTLRVDGYFFTDGDYGKQVVIVANGKKVNMPNRAVRMFEDIDRDPEMIKAILEGHLQIIDIEPQKTKRGMTTAFTLEDC